MSCIFNAGLLIVVFLLCGIPTFNQVNDLNTTIQSIIILTDDKITLYKHYIKYKTQKSEVNLQ